MSAGVSARYEAQRSLLESDEYARLSAQCRRRALSFRAAADSEESVGATLCALEELGWVVLADRRWGRRANVDFLLVGPAGVVVVDVKNWRDLQVRGDSIFREDECCDAEIDKNLDLTGQVVASLGELGVTPSSVLTALVFHRRSLQQVVRGVHLLGEGNVAVWLTRRPGRFDAATVAAVVAVLSEAYPAFGLVPDRPVVPAPRRVVVPRVAATTRTDVPQESLFDVDELADALLEAALAAPIEEWMTFLHPSQLKLVSARHKGPARVRGSAGTGKTVVGLHRAANLARTSKDPILFVTFVRTLPVVLRSLATRLAPDDVVRIEFTGLHQLARRVLGEAGVDVPLNRAKVNTAFARAWVAVGRGSSLEGLDERPSYWQEEIDYVIKGRGITDFEEYSELARTGRRTRMTRAHRQIMWDVYVAYSEHLTRAGTKDFNDWLIVALDLVRAGAVPIPCGGVIVDEVQDLTMVGLQFLHALAGDGQDRFLVIGDGQQSIYPGGFTLSEAGVDVRGRATVLEVNYRNTKEILEAARLVIGGDAFDDLEGASESGDRQVEVRRQGNAPVIFRGASQRQIEHAVLARLRELQDDGARLGDVAVLTLGKRDAERYKAVLRSGGFAAMDLIDYAGVATDAVKIGTVKRAKGLEFAQVLLPELDEEVPSPAPGESHESYEERRARHCREVFVAMTRARDGLWLGYLACLAETRPADSSATIS